MERYQSYTVGAFKSLKFCGVEKIPTINGKYKKINKDDVIAFAGERKRSMKMAQKNRIYIQPPPRRFGYGKGQEIECVMSKILLL